MKYSIDQEKAISSRGADVLVSAAAGSGKTAVMVERVIREIQDEEADINEFIIMTFTRAAAESMRMRIAGALSEKALEDPSDRRVRMQMAMLPGASISTIHSFAEKLIRQHYQKLSIDPLSRVIDEGEQRMLMGDVLSELIEDQLSGEPDPAFLMLMEFVSSGADDRRINDAVKSLYDFAMAKPWPEDFLGKLAGDCRTGETAWTGELIEFVGKETKGEQRLLEEALRVSLEERGPFSYAPMLIEDIELCRDIEGKKSYEELYELMSHVKFTRLGSMPRKSDYDRRIGEWVKSVRNGFRKFIRKMAGDFFLLDPAALKVQTQGSAGLSLALISLTLSFKKRYDERKRSANLMDFNDLEQLSLELLYEREDVRYVPSALADELARRYREIMVDEYQDSNSVQEAIIQALSGARLGRRDLFMVGDVKQSIYSFRNAEPGIFTDKYGRFPDAGDAPERRIDLSLNFRSREEVIDSVNRAFTLLMHEETCGIEYDSRARLTVGASYPAGTGYETEILVGDRDSLKEAPEGYSWTRFDLEELMIMKKIDELTGRSGSGEALMITDEKSGELRRANFGDITILVRKKRYAGELLDFFRERGVPAYFESSEGYFETEEVHMMMSLLMIIDNPLQDIPLVTVMKGPIGDFSDDELALIRIEFLEKKRSEEGDRHTEAGDFYRALSSFAVSKGDKGLEADAQREIAGKKARRFLDMLCHFREKSDILPVHMLLNEIYCVTGYYDYVSALYAGDIRAKNLDMLVQKAEAFQKTSYTGLFNFVRYIEELRKYETDYGEAPSDAGHDDSVKIMTIHGAKGLEFPIVFLAMAGEALGAPHGSPLFAVDSTGLSCDYTDPETRISYPGLRKALIMRNKKDRELAEELRLLYVAMTRAKEKLIISGTMNRMEAVRDEYELTTMICPNLPASYVRNQNSYLKWLLLSGAGEKESFFTLSSLMEEAREGESLAAEQRLLFREEAAAAEESADLFRLRESFSAVYSHPEETKLRPKISVSEIKEMRKEALESGRGIYELDEEGNVVRPGSRPPGDKYGALRGTAFHRAMELTEFGTDPEVELARILSDPRFAPQEKALLDCEAVKVFLSSPLAKRMRRAHTEGKLFREQHFMAAFPADSLKECQHSHEEQILQGIIDAYFEEDGELVIVDFKTDRVRRPEELRELYFSQLSLYRRALSKLRQLDVKECLIYSSCLSQTIEC